MDATTLQTSILNAFLAMNDKQSGGDVYCANELAKAIYDFIKSGNVTSEDVGSVGSSAYTGNGSAKMEIDKESLANKLYATFTQENLTDDGLAEDIADDIDSVCSIKDLISTVTNGTLTPPSGSPTKYSGTGKGTFSGVKLGIATSLKAAFESMKTRYSGGNEIYAAALATSINTYMTVGSTIAITLDTPIEGTGKGEIA